MTNEERLDHINKTMQAIAVGWPFLLVEIESTIRDKTESLIVKDDEQTRGAIKALRDLTSLPETLHQEREGLTAALSDEDAAL
jgi:hypothetical protein